MGDVLRLDCKCGVNGGGMSNALNYLKPLRYINNVTWDTECCRTCKHGEIFSTTLPCDKDWKYCGGTHAVIWRSDRLHKLRDLWMRDPVSDIDCMLTTNKLNSYCVQGSVVTRKEFNSTIPKMRDKIIKNDYIEKPEESNETKCSYSYREHLMDSINFRMTLLQGQIAIFKRKKKFKRKK